MTPDVVNAIKSMLKEDCLYQQQIAAIVGVNQGRVSEVKNGSYD